MNNETLEQKDSSKKLSNLSIGTNILLKRDVLAKYQVNLDDVLTLSKKTMINLNKTLKDISTKYLSVTSLSIDPDLFRELRKQIKNRNKFVEKNLPFQVKEYDWLVNYTAQYIKEKYPHVKDSLTDIKKFLTKSDEFRSALEKLEQSLISKVVETTYISDIPLAERKKRVEKNQMYNYEDNFRTLVLFNMELLGVDRHTTDVALEKNAQLWRRLNMKRTFTDFYYNPENKPSNQASLKTWDYLREEHFKRWIQHHEYEYYQEHKNAIDEAGTATASMLMTERKAGEVLQSNVELNDLRRKFITHDFNSSSLKLLEHSILLVL
ncbi:MAG: hypothetical protein MJ054_00110 [Clostridia bacterium]|nr:hypothetical protein [Clostridia bacterium]